DSASSARRLARAESCPAVNAVIKNAKNATQLSGLRIANVPNGGRKKKLKQATPNSEANTAGREPHAVAMKSTTRRNPSPAVVGLTWGPNSFSKHDAAAMPNSAAT